MIPFILSLGGQGGTPTPPPIDADYDVFLVSGQSNSGQQAPTTDPNAPSYLSANTVPGVYSYNNTTIVSDYSLSDTGPNGNGWPYVTGASLNNRFTYKEVALYEIAQARPNNNVLMCQVTNGGSTLGLNQRESGSWNVDFDNVIQPTPLFAQLLKDKYDSLLAFASANNLTLNVRGMLWHQGESGSPGTDYQTALQAFFDYVRTFTNKPNLPIVSGTIPDTSNNYNASIRTAMLNVANADANIYYRDNNGLTFFDGIHFDAQSCVTFGNWAKDIVINNIF